jgi:hypothetical protein
VEGDSGLVAQRDRLHRRDIQERRKDDVLQGRFSLKDPSRLFNSSLDGNVRRAIDIHEGEEINAPALNAFIRAAVALNVSGRKAATSKRGGG